jgi:UDP:flavonoid glycosyltransferase YjiC (YdhE family)
MCRHVNPTLDLVAALIQRGYTVTYFASEKFRARLEAIGAKLIWYAAVRGHRNHYFRLCFLHYFHFFFFRICC